MLYNPRNRSKVCFYPIHYIIAELSCSYLFKIYFCGPPKHTYPCHFLLLSLAIAQLMVSNNSKTYNLANLWEKLLETKTVIENQGLFNPQTIKIHHRNQCAKLKCYNCSLSAHRDWPGKAVCRSGDTSPLEESSGCCQQMTGVRAAFHGDF